jgi:hypothetical protein
MKAIMAGTFMALATAPASAAEIITLVRVPRNVNRARNSRYIDPAPGGWEIIDWRDVSSDA